MSIPLISRLRVAISAFLILVVVTPATAQTQRAEWRGFAYLSDFTNACQQEGWGGRVQLNVRYRPAGLVGNGTASRLSFFDTFYAFGFYLDGASFTRQWQEVGAAGIGSSPYIWENPDHPTAIRVLTHAPTLNRLTENSRQVRLVGEIRNFDAIPFCRVTFEATMIRRQ